MESWLQRSGVSASLSDRLLGGCITLAKSGQHNLLAFFLLE